MEKEFENTFETIKHEDSDFSSQKRAGKIFSKIMNQFLLMSYFHQRIARK